MPPGEGQPMLSMSPSGPALSSLGKEPSSSRKEPPSTPSLLMKGGQSLLQMIPCNGSLRSENLVGDGSRGVKQGSIARNCTRIPELRDGNRGDSAGAEAEVHCAHYRPCAGTVDQYRIVSTILRPSIRCVFNTRISYLRSVRQFLL